jgi:hypothetical protein
MCGYGCRCAVLYSLHQQPSDLLTFQELSRNFFLSFLTCAQTVDAVCLRYLLGDAGVDLETVVAGYRQQFAFGASQRVKSSVMDQLSFLEEVLQGRVGEAEVGIREGAIAQGYGDHFVSESAAAPVDEPEALPVQAMSAISLTAGATGTSESGPPTNAAGRRAAMGRCTSVMVSPAQVSAIMSSAGEKGPVRDAAAILSTSVAELLSLPGVSEELAANPDLERHLRIRGSLLTVLRKVCCA